MSKFATGLLAGLGQGLGVMGGGMLRDIQADDDEARAQRRAKMLAEIQREHQRTLRQDDLDFRTDPKNVERVRAVAKGDELAKLDPELVGARAKAKSGEILGTADAEAQAAGKRQAAVSDETLRELYPGQVLTRGGKLVEENKRPTSQEVQDRLYSEGLKTSGRGGGGGGGGGSSPYERMDEADKVQVQATNKQINDISAAMTKGLADGSLSADKADPGYKSYQALMVQRRQAEMARDAVMRKYADETPGSGAPRDDPLGLRGGNGGGSGGGSKAPAGGGGGQIDPKDNRAKILADELKKARAAGNADDVKALQSEVDKLPKDVRQAVLDRIRNESAAPAPAPAPAAPNKAPAPAPAAAAQPPGLLDKLGSKLAAWRAENAADWDKAEALIAKKKRGEPWTPEEKREARRLHLN